MLQLITFTVCLIGLYFHSLITYHKYKFSKLDIVVFIIFFAGISFSILTTLFNFQN